MLLISAVFRFGGTRSATSRDDGADTAKVQTGRADVTLLVTHYNRCDSLARLLRTLTGLNCRFADIVVSDDGSNATQLERLRDLQKEYPFRLITTPVNRGLGNNLNKGQDAVKTEYTLYVQEDFCPTPLFPGSLTDALQIMEERREIDLIRFWCYAQHPRRKPYRNRFSEMEFRLLTPGAAKFFCYSDTPHLRRKNFFERFGRYAEGVRAIKTEKSMVMSFLQARGRALQCDRNDLFTHENLATEPSTQDYSAFFKLRRRLPAPLFGLMWTAKLTAEYLFKRFRQG